MDSTLINIRIFSWHFQVQKNWLPSIGRNDYHKEKDWPDGYFRVYRFFWYHN